MPHLYASLLKQPFGYNELVDMPRNYFFGEIGQLSYLHTLPRTTTVSSGHTLLPAAMSRLLYFVVPTFITVLRYFQSKTARP